MNTETKVRKRCYLAGPMSGYEDFNFPAFFHYADRLRKKGYIVFNPAENDLRHYGDDFLQHPERFNPRETMDQDCEWICKYADVVALMPGWEKSKGVAIEKGLADYLGLEVIILDPI